MRRGLNLASRPFRNETLPAVLLGSAAAALLGLTVYHGFVIRSLLPGRSSARHAELDRLERKVARLRTEAELSESAPPAPVLAEWRALEELVDRRRFSWTELLATLEETLPLGVRLISISPAVSRGEVDLDLTATARSIDDGLALVSRFQEREEFDEVRPLSRSDTESGQSFHYTMQYRPPAGDGGRP
jgi:hypothetical protein